MFALIIKDQELCESGSGHPGLPVPNGPYGQCGRKATLNKLSSIREAITITQGNDSHTTERSIIEVHGSAIVLRLQSIEM